MEKAQENEEFGVSNTLVSVTPTEPTGRIVSRKANNTVILNKNDPEYDRKMKEAWDAGKVVRTLY